MDKLKRYLGQVLFNSTFGVTLLTVSAMILIIGFLIESTHNGTRQIDIVDDPSDDLPASSSVATSCAAVKPSDRYAGNIGVVAPRMTPKYIARLVRTCDCRWTKGSEALREGTPLRAGQTLDVDKGLAEIAFACGAKAILQGPAVLELQSEKSSALRAGRLTADVPDEVEGFTVRTPVVQVVSLCSLELKPVARLTSAVDCRWAEGSAANKEGAGLKPGEKVKLLQGLAQITFACGAKVILQGPAELEIESPKTAVLHSGKLTADVPDEVEGFKIHTPVAEITALPADSKVTKEKNAPKAKPSAVKAAAETDVVVLKPGQHARIEAPAKGMVEKVQSPPKTPPAKS